MGGRIYYDIKLWVVWCGKVLAQVVESTLIVWEDLGSSPMYANVVLLFVIILIYVNHVGAGWVEVKGKIIGDRWELSSISI